MISMSLACIFSELAAKILNIQLLHFLKFKIVNLSSNRTEKMENIELLFRESLKLRPAERLQLIELIAKSLDQPDEKINEVWAAEAESRYQALQQEKVNTIPFSEIMARYK